MGWGHNPSFRISQRTLDFEAARKIFKDEDLWHRGYSGANIGDYPPGRSNYWIYCDTRTNPITNTRMECYYLRMYQTDIHMWWEDGTYQSRYWDSAPTRDTLTAFGPVRVFRDSQSKFIDKDRFGLWQGKNYPYDSGITVDPEGWIHDVTDFKYALKAGARSERSKLRREFRDKSVSRILLGEFGPLFAEHKTDVKKGFGRWETGWMAKVPPVHIARLFAVGMDHDRLEKAIEDSRPQYWDTGPTRDTLEMASLQSVYLMEYALLNDHDRWYEKVPVAYGNINVREL